MIFRLASVALLVAVASAIATAENSQSSQVAFAIVALAVLATGIFVPQSAFDRFARLLRPISIAILAVPAFCMIVQVLPIPIRGWGNPIWATASAALNDPLAERFTVDIRATVLALAQYNAVVATALITMIITLDRQKAAHFLYILLFIATCESTFSLLGRSVPLLSNFATVLVNSPVAAVLGILLSCTVILREIEQSGYLHPPPRFSVRLAGALSLALFSLLICTAAIFVRGNSTIFIAALLGVEVLLAVVTIRNWFWGIWGTAGVLATAALVLAASFSAIPIKKDTDLTIALSRQNQSATERMLQDIGPGGSGAGAFNALLPIYRDIGKSSLRERPTDAAAIAVDMGRWFLCALLIIVVLGACTLAKRSLSRRHDYVYAAVGAAASVSLAILAFSVGGLLDLGASLLVAGLYGLAFGQSLSNAARKLTSPEAQEQLMEFDGQRQQARPALPTTFGGSWSRIALLSLALVLLTQLAWVLSDRWNFGDESSIASDPVLKEVLPETTSIAPTRAEDLAEGVPAATDFANDAPLLSPQHHDTPSGLHLFATKLRYSPLRGDLWLLLAALSTETQWHGYDTAGLLKMSYYTAPNDIELFPLRLCVALSRDALVRDVELRDLIRRDIKVIVTRQPALKPALVTAYRSASADGKSFAEILVSEFDPTYLQNMRGRAEGFSER